MMDIQKEREAFEIAYSEIFSPIIKRPYPVLENGDYKYIEIDQAWKLWQAKSQAVPEGFVLINAESLALHAQSIRMFNNGEEEDDYFEIENHVCAIEAMIKAQEQSHEE